MLTDIRNRPEKALDLTSERPSKRSIRSFKGLTLNWRLLLATVLILGVLAPAVYYWHAFQVERNASSLLILADRDEKRSEWLKAAESLYRYLQLRPNDVETLVRLAEDYQKGAKQPLQKARAMQFYARAISLAPDRDDLQRSQMALRLETGDERGALEQAKKLLEEDPADAEALRVRAIALHRRKRLRGSVTDEALLAAYNAAIDKNPGSVELAAGLALFYRSEMTPSKQQSRVDLEKLADNVMDNLTAAPEATAETFIARYLYRQQFNLADADADLDRAISADAAKKTFSVWLLSGARAQAAGDYEAAVKHFSDAVAIDANDRRGYLGLGNAYGGLGDDARAIRAWRNGLFKSSPGDIEFELLIVAAEVRQGHWERVKTELNRLEKKLAQMAGPQQADLLATVWSLRAEVAIGQKQFGAALVPLKQALASKQAGAESLARAGETSQIQARLGYCYQVIGQWDQAALAYQRAADLMPRDPTPRLAAAAAWEAAGRFDEAVRRYDDALPLKGVGANAFVAAANAKCLWQLSLPQAQRNWQPLTNHIAKAKLALANEGSLEPPILRLVESEYDAALGLVDQAVERCRNSVEPAVMASADLVRRLALDYESWGRAEEADRLLEQLGETQKNSVGQALLASELQFHRNRREDAYRLLAEALTDASDESRRAIEDRLAAMYLADGKTELAKPLLERLAKMDAGDTRPLQFLVELELQDGKLDKSAPLVNELETREGPEGVAWRYYRAQQFMLQAGKIQQTDPSDAANLYQRAASLQEEIQALRPAWAPGYLLKARLAESRPIKTTAMTSGAAPLHDDAAAVKAYVQAIRLGARSVPVYESLILLLFRQNRVSEAEDYLSQLREIAPLTDRLSTVAMAIDVNQGNLERAVEMAKKLVAEAPKDAMHRLRLGMLLAQSGADGKPDQAKLAEAELALKQARDLAPADSRTWSALLSFYMGNEQTENVAKLLKEVRETKPLGENRTPFFLAQGYAAIDDEQQATLQYREAIAAESDDAAVQFQSGLYFAKRDLGLAETCMRRALEIDPAHRGAAEMLAVLLASRGGAEEEIDRLLSQGQIQPSDKRLHAVLMLRRGGVEHRRRAQEILEALADNAQQVSSVDHLLLARLYETEARLAAARGDTKVAESSMAAAREQFKALVNGADVSPEHLAAYIDNLLRSGRTVDAAGKLDELARIEPESASLRTLSLRLRWLNAQNEERRIKPLIDSYVSSHLEAASDENVRSRALQGAAELYTTYSLLDEAEQALRQALELDAGAITAMVNWLGQQGRTSDAVRLCVELTAKDPSPLPAMLLANLLAIGKPTDEDVQSARPVIDRALQEHKDHPGLLFSISIKRLMEGDNEESIRLIRKVLKLQPANLPAMNNLAILLSMKPDGREEAAQWIAKAIALAGSSPELLDSKGWVLMQQRELPEAVEAFEEALAAAPADARYHFHLALALQLQGKLKEARDAFEISRRSGIQAVPMPPDERSALSRLESALQ